METPRDHARRRTETAETLENCGAVFTYYGGVAGGTPAERGYGATKCAVGERLLTVNKLVNGMITFNQQFDL
jgi:hypothetical protein